MFAAVTSLAIYALTSLSAAAVAAADSSVAGSRYKPNINYSSGTSDIQIARTEHVVRQYDGRIFFIGVLLFSRCFFLNSNSLSRYLQPPVMHKIVHILARMLKTQFTWRFGIRRLIWNLLHIFHRSLTISIGFCSYGYANDRAAAAAAAAAKQHHLQCHKLQADYEVKV